MCFDPKVMELAPDELDPDPDSVSIEPGKSNSEYVEEYFSLHHSNRNLGMNFDNNIPIASVVGSLIKGPNLPMFH